MLNPHREHFSNGLSKNRLITIMIRLHKMEHLLSRKHSFSPCCVHFFRTLYSVGFLPDCWGELQYSYWLENALAKWIQNINICIYLPHCLMFMCPFTRHSNSDEAVNLLSRWQNLFEGYLQRSLPNWQQFISS